MWWMVDVGFSHVLDEENLTQAQEKFLHLDYQATNIFYSSMKDNIFGEIMDMKSAHEIWSYLNEKYRAINKEDDVPKWMHVGMLSMTTTWWSWRIAPPHGQVRMKMMAMRVMLLQAHPLHRIPPCLTTTTRYLLEV